MGATPEAILGGLPLGAAPGEEDENTKNLFPIS